MSIYPTREDEAFNAGVESVARVNRELVKQIAELKVEQERLSSWIKAANQFAWAHERDCPRRELGGACTCGLDQFLGRPKPFVESFKAENERLNAELSATREQLAATSRVLAATEDRYNKLDSEVVGLRGNCQQLRNALEKHHKWHLEIGKATFREHDPNGDGLTVREYELDLSAEYCDSSLYDETEQALKLAAHASGRDDSWTQIDKLEAVLRRCGGLGVETWVPDLEGEAGRWFRVGNYPAARTLKEAVATALAAQTTEQEQGEWLPIT